MDAAGCCCCCCCCFFSDCLAWGDPNTSHKRVECLAMDNGWIKNPQEESQRNDVSRDPQTTPIQNPLKYGNGMDPAYGVQCPTIGGPWRNPEQ